MDGVFMLKTIKGIGVLFIGAAFLFSISLLRDHKILKNELVRLHVVGQSNSEEDQSVKRSVRDTVLTCLEDLLHGITDVEQAKQRIQSCLPQIEEAANKALRQLGVDSKAVVRFLKEEFPIRDYDTFSLPSGIYQSLRVIIGEGEGQNWWCVVFPTLCMGSSAADVEDVAAGAGFSENLADTITGSQGYRIRFYLLDVLGKLENFFHRS
jgi:stage II sporulation protein R